MNILLIGAPGAGKRKLLDQHIANRAQDQNAKYQHNSYSKMANGFRCFHSCWLLPKRAALGFSRRESSPGVYSVPNQKV